VPIREFEFIDLDGKTVRVNRLMKMTELPDEILIKHTDGNTYPAKRIVSQTAKMASNWAVRGTSSNLPNENSGFLSKTDVLPEN
jgi:hypothetical protein